MSTDMKSVILYHRSYRKIAVSAKPFVLQLVCIALPLSLIVVFFYPEITRTVCRIAVQVLSPYFDKDSLRIVSYPYIIGNGHYLALPGKFPSAVFSLVNTIFSLLMLLLLPNINRLKPLLILGTVLSFILFISAMFFLLVPDQFPYQASDYSDLYIKQQISIWFFVPVIMGLGVLPLPASLPSKIFTMLISFVYSLIFGTVRYVVFLYIIGKISLIYMAVLFFALGPLVDFVYIVGIYSCYTTRLAKKIKGNFTLWKWSY